MNHLPDLDVSSLRNSVLRNSMPLHGSGSQSTKNVDDSFYSKFYDPTPTGRPYGRNFFGSLVNNSTSIKEPKPIQIVKK